MIYNDVTPDQKSLTKRNKSLLAKSPWSGATASRLFYWNSRLKPDQ